MDRHAIKRFYWRKIWLELKVEAILLLSGQLPFRSYLLTLNSFLALLTLDIWDSLTSGFSSKKISFITGFVSYLDVLRAESYCISLLYFCRLDSPLIEWPCPSVGRLLLRPFVHKRWTRLPAVDYEAKTLLMVWICYCLM